MSNKNHRNNLYIGLRNDYKGYKIEEVDKLYNKDTRILFSFSNSKLTDTIDCSKDLLGNEYIVVGMPTLTNELSKSKFGRAINFDGSTYIRTKDKIPLWGRDFTIELWGNMSSSTVQWSGFFYCCVETTPASRLGEFGLLRSGNSNYLDLSLWNESGSSITSDRQINFNPIDSLHHYAVVYQHDKRLFRTYIDGVQKDSFSCQIQEHEVYLWIGFCSFQNWYFLTGSIEEFRLTDRALYTTDFTPLNKPFKLSSIVFQSEDKEMSLRSSTNTNTLPVPKIEAGITYDISGDDLISNLGVKFSMFDGSSLVKVANPFNTGTDAIRIDAKVNKFLEIKTDPPKTLIGLLHRFTVCGWFKFWDSNRKGTNPFIVSNGVDNYTGFGFGTFFNAYCCWGFTGYGNYTSNILWDINKTPTNEWFFFELSFDNGVSTYYLNGRKIAECTEEHTSKSNGWYFFRDDAKYFLIGQWSYVGGRESNGSVFDFYDLNIFPAIWHKSNYQVPTKKLEFSSY